MADRGAAALAFLAAAGWAAAARVPLAGDASARRYWRLRRGADRAVLMDAPPGQADRVADFTRIARHLRGLGLSAPAILAEDAAAGFLLLEDLGDDLYARVCAADPGVEPALYAAAAGVLAHLQAHPPPPGLPDLTAADWAAAALVGHDPADPAVADLRAALADAIRAHADGPRVLILRDFHAENLLWLPDRDGSARVGLLDFQLGQMGQPGYDLVSLTLDARRDVAPAAEAAALAALPVDDAARAVLAAQRSLRILGVFARLSAAGKPQYLALVPRVRGHLARALRHPALARVAPLVPRVVG